MERLVGPGQLSTFLPSASLSLSFSLLSHAEYKSWFPGFGAFRRKRKREEEPIPSLNTILRDATGAIAGGGSGAINDKVFARARNAQPVPIRPLHFAEKFERSGTVLTTTGPDWNVPRRFNSSPGDIIRQKFIPRTCFPPLCMPGVFLSSSRRFL